MTAITKQTQHPIDLEKYKIDFGREFGEKFYWEHLNQLSVRKRAELFGYEYLRDCSQVYPSTQYGQYITSRFLKACKGLHIDPSGIFSKYQSKVFRMGKNKNGGRWKEVSEELKETILNKMCDDYDNQS